VLCFSEEVVREVVLYLLEVVSERGERAMVGASEQEVELCTVELESVYLAMFEFQCADDGFG